MDASALLNIQAIYHDPKRAEWTTYESYHILITWYAGSSKTQTEKLCKLRDIYYSMGSYSKIFTCIRLTSKFELPRRQSKTDTINGCICMRKTKFFFPNFPNFIGTQWGECGKKNFRYRWEPNKTKFRGRTNCTVEDIGRPS